MAKVQVVWDDAAIRLSAANPHGEIGQAMRTLADETVRLMKAEAPVYTGPPRTGPTLEHPRQVARRSGTLRSSIRHFKQPNGNYLIGPVDQAAAGVFLGPLIEHGTPRHRIRSQGPWPLYSTATRQRYGRPVYAGPPGRKRLLYWEVNHPGTAPNPFIARAVRAMNGRTVRIR